MDYLPRRNFVDSLPTEETQMRFESKHEGAFQKVRDPLSLVPRHINAPGEVHPWLTDRLTIANV